MVVSGLGEPVNGEGNWVGVGPVNCMCGGCVDQESLLVVVM